MAESMQATLQNRRESDTLPHISLLLDIKTEVSNMRQEIKAEVSSLKAELTEFKKDINKAFTKDEEGLPDYHAHRIRHTKLDKEDAKTDDYYTDFVKSLIRWAGIGLATLILSALIYYFKAGQV